MGRNSGAISNHKKDRRKSLAGQFERALRRAQWIGLAEEFYSRAVPPLALVTGTFLASSWFGLWKISAPSLRVAGVIMFAGALVSALRPLLKIKMPDRKSAIKKLDVVNGPGEYLATTYNDLPLSEGQCEDRESTALSKLDRQRIEESVGRFRAGYPHFSLGEHTPLFAGVVLMTAVISSLVIAAEKKEISERITAITDWQVQTPEKPPLLLEALVKKPFYTKQSDLPIVTRSKPLKPGSKDYTVPANSTLTIQAYDKNAHVISEGGIDSHQKACQSFDVRNMIQCKFSLQSNASVRIYRDGDKAGYQWNFEVTPDRVPQVTLAPLSQGDKKLPDLSVEIKDEFGAVVPGVDLELTPQPSHDSEPLPLYNVPSIFIPAR